MDNEYYAALSAFVVLMQKANIHFNSLAPAGQAQRIKLFDHGCAADVQRMAGQCGLDATVRDGYQNGPVITLRKRR